ncbi:MULTISPECIES: ubiquinol oxidase subunit II [Alteromonas]|uniref:Ubiquinol oxidase subunit 2 n=1 Tax=Alteromonas macleodii TaxID=28108 RepID=A0A6T9Y439_ALTMA|nr:MULTISPECIES: ubiquinol oxidase subunit II [Alteromonas]TAP29197.1 ubiquinol oxidase subunit II [Alteromonas sp. KUL17]GEA02566.1 ubiquinol oxidase subunit 2 [Alteromonas sp. KUL17]CAB9495837.1 cytochrome o ubiquinol oxidase subunit II [Alteromonas macleodii]
MSIRNLFTLIVAGAGLTLAGCSGGVLDPKGQVGMDEKNLIILCTILMLIVVVPVIVLTLYFAWKYRASRDFEIYTPKWAHSTKIEAIVWSIPILIVISLSVITWRSTHALDPYSPLEGKGEHLTVEVVSLNWKWLFIYPEQGIATVNELVFPANKPVAFKITSESTMNSFFIPQLGSQIYSMAGMETKLHLIADEPGTYKGISSNYSGAGFTGMKFNAIATPTEGDFNDWVASVKQAQTPLTSASYEQLAKPSENNPVTYYSNVSEGLFHDIVMKYMKDHGSMDFYSKPENAATGEHHTMPQMQHRHHQEDAQ